MNGAKHYREIQDSIATLLRSKVKNVGRIATFPRAVTTPEDFRSAFQTDLVGEQTKIRAWVIVPQRITLESDEAAIGQMLRHYEFLIQGYQALRRDGKDTEAFWRIAERILDALEEEITLRKTVEIAEPPALTLGGTMMLGSVLCDYCEITLRATARKAVSYR